MSNIIVSGLTEQNGFAYGLITKTNMSHWQQGFLTLPFQCLGTACQLLCPLCVQHLWELWELHLRWDGFGWLTLGLDTALWPGDLTVRADCAVVPFTSNPTETPWKSFKCCKTETRLWLDPKYVCHIHAFSYFFINSRVTSAENRGPHNILGQCLKVMDIWNSLPDVFISLYNACWAHPVVFTWSI